MRDLMRLSLSAACVAALTPAAISAAETGPWTGPSIGLHAGYTNYTSTWNDQDYDWHGGQLVFQNSGLVAGASVGYDHQFGSLVLGASFDWDRAAIKSAWRYADDDNVENDFESMRSFRLRAGFAAESTLFYLTAGVAKGEFVHSWSEDADPTDSWASFNNEQTGRVLGVGLEQLIAERWSIGAELLSYSFGETEATNPDGYTMRVKEELLSARLNVNYRF